MTMAGNITSDAIANLDALNRTELGERFRDIFGRPAPKGMSRPLLLRIIAYRIQEDAMGGPNRALRRRLSAHRVDRHNGARCKNPSPLAGKLFDDKGASFTPSHAVKKGRRYRYYIERVDTQGDHDVRPQRKRISADEIESLVVVALIRLLEASAKLIEATAASNLDAANTKSLLKHASDLARNLKGRNGQDDYLIVRTLIGKVIIGEKQVRVMVSISGLRSLLEIEDAERTLCDDDHEIVIPARQQPRGVELKLVILDPSYRSKPKPDPTLIKALIKANAWLDMLLTDEQCTINKIANAEGVTGRYIRRLLELAFLAPDITEVILDGLQSADISTEWLVRHVDLPLVWQEQRQVLGLPL